MNPILSAPHFDAALIARYDNAGPRYTSYPTALQFGPDFDEDALRSTIAASNEEPIPRPLSLYVHVPFCRSPCFYCGCSRVITRDAARADAFLQHLQCEIVQVSSWFDADRAVRQLHFGGGTPNFLDIGRMRMLLGTLASHFTFADRTEREFGIEIDPRFADADYIQGLGELGFNRLSVGIQDFDTPVQRAVNRIQSVRQTRDVLVAARSAGFRSISVDLIYGLPMQTLEGFDRSLDEVIALAPNRVAVYGYAHMPQLFKAQGQIDAADLPDPALRLQLFGRALERLSGAGYRYIGMDHFARVDDELVLAQQRGTLQRNFQGYSTHGNCDIVGLGPSAISRIGDSYSQNLRDLDGYYAALAAGHAPVARGIVLDDDDILRRELINALMCHGELDTATFAATHRIDFASYFADSLARLKTLAEDGLVTMDARYLRVTAKGRLLLRAIAMCFDRYLAPERATGYSRVI
jgi:oxygen-independent coproporphyrinogen-3 oxidase